MATPFTSWAALYTAMLNTLADNAANNRFAVFEYTITTGGISRGGKYRSFAEFERGLSFVKMMADRETGAAVGRTYAKPIG